MADEIQIHGLRVSTRIGVSAEERRTPQRLVVNILMTPLGGFARLGDAVENTADYEQVAREVRELCGAGERCLIETLAGDIASLLLERHALAAVAIEVRKFVLPECDCVGVRIRRERAERK